MSYTAKYNFIICRFGSKIEESANYRLNQITQIIESDRCLVVFHIFFKTAVRRCVLSHLPDDDIPAA